MAADFLYAWRTLRRAKGFTLSIIATLGIGMGVTAVIFDAARLAFLAPLPYARPDALVHVAVGRTDGPAMRASYPEYREWRDGSRAFTAMAAYSRTNRTLTGTGPAERLAVTQVSEDFFTTLGVDVAGRAFTPAEERAGADRVAIATAGFVRTHFSEGRDAAGAIVRLGGVPYQIVGILPASFRFDLDAPDLFIPLGLTEIDETRRDSRWLGVIARLREGVTRSAAARELDASLVRAGESRAAAIVEPLRDTIVGRARPVLFALAGGALFVLLAAAASVANLVSARVVSRQRELAIRAAIGAPASALWRLVAMELAVLASAAAVASWACAAWAAAFLRSAAPAWLMARLRFLEPLGTTAFATTAAAALPIVAMALALGLASFDVRRGTRASAADVSGSGRGASRVTLRRSLVGLQVATTVALVIGAALLGRSVAKLLDRPLGFRLDNAVAVKVSVSGERYDTPAQVAAFYERLVQAVSGIPGVAHAAIVDELPLTKDTGAVLVAPAPDGNARRVSALIRSAGPGYFETLGIPTRAGRTFAPTDGPDRPDVVVVSRRLAAMLFPGRDPLGARVTFGHPTVYTVVGVVDDVRMGELDRDIAPAVYTCALQDPSRSAVLVIRSSTPVPSLVAAVRTRMAALDPTVPGYGAQTLAGVRSATAGLALRSAALYPMAAFGVLTMMVAMIGVYGILSYLVAQRTRELGIRIALGAQRSDVVRYALWQGLAPVLAGLAGGVLTAALASRLAASLLFEVPPADPAAFGGAVSAILMAAVLACALPVVRAARIDPVQALAAE